MDVYLPAPLEEMGREGQKRPVPVICPGGAYRFCSRREAEPIALHFLTDGCCVLELICQNAEQWHCDTEKIALMGFSAGGHLAAHYANAYDIPQVRWAFPHSKGVQASLLCYPVINSREDLRHAESFRNLTGTEDWARWEQVSCEKLVTEKTPPPSCGTRRRTMPSRLPTPWCTDRPWLNTAYPLKCTSSRKEPTGWPRQIP